MDNEVIINVVSRNNVKSGFDAARADAHKAGLDIEKDFKSSGERAGKELSKGVSDGAKGAGADFKKTGEKAGTDLSSGILGKFKSLVPPSMTAGLVEAGIAASPFLGAVISGAIIGGAGIGGVIGGAIIASKDPGVQQAFKALGTEASASLKFDAAPMIGPVLKSIDTIKESFRSISPVLQNIFAKSADFIGPLTGGITRAVEGIADGINDLVENAGPTVDAFGQLFGDVGESIGDALTTISGDSEDATDAIQDLGSILSFLIEAVGLTVRALTEAYGAMNDFGAAVVDSTYKIGGLAPRVDEVGTFMRHTTSAIHAQVGAFKQLADEMQAQTDPLFALIQGQQDVAKAQSHYNDVLKKHKKNSAEAKDAMADLGEKAFALQGKIAAAAGGFNGRLTPAMKTALKNAGLTKTQIGRLESQLRSAADAANAWSGTFRQTYITSFKTFGKPYSQDGIDRGQVGGLASGGISGSANGASPTGMTWVGENGPELLKLSPGSRVYSNPDSMRPGGPLTMPGSPMGTPGAGPGGHLGLKPRLPVHRTHPNLGEGGGSSGGGGGSGGGSGSSGDPFIVNLTLDGKVLVSALVDPMRNFVRYGFGGSVQKAYGVGMI